MMRSAALPFLVIAMFTIWAFWPYYSDLGNPPYPMTAVTHIHAFLMTAWVVMLILQPLLVRSGKRAIHKRVGQSSYALVPLILISGIVATRRSTGTLTEINDYYYHAFLHSILTLVAFAVIFALAIKHRRNVSVHARYMICTIFPLFSPVFSRILANHFGFIAEALPTLDGVPLWQIIAFMLADVILILMAIVDYRSTKRRDVFPVALGVMLVFHISDFILYRIPFIRSVIDGVMA